MEEDTNNSRRGSPANMDTVLHHVLLPSILDAKAKAEMGPDVALPEILHDCLKTAGISFHGQDALQLHFHLFSSCFAHNSEINRQLAEKPSFTSIDYFLSVVDVKLQWFSFYLEMLPYLRISVIIEVMSDLADLFKNQAEGRQLTGMELCLMASSLEMILIVFIDLCAQRDEETGYKSDGKLDEHTEEFNDMAEKLSKLVAVCLAHITETVKKEETVAMLKRQPFAIQYLGDILSIATIFLNPFDSEEDTTSFIYENKKEIVWASRHVKSSNHFEMKEMKRTTKLIEMNDEMLCLTIHKDCELKMMKHNSNLTNKVEQRKEEDVDKTEGSLYQDGVRDAARKENRVHCDRILLGHLRRSISPKTFVGIVSFLICGDTEESDSVYEYLRNVVCGQNFVKIGQYVLARESVFSHVREKLHEIREIVWKGEMTTFPLLEELGSLLKNSNESSSLDVKRGDGKSEALVLWHETSNCAERLDVVKKAVKHREDGWQELLCHGMRQTDMETWWNAGFHDLVWENIDWLSNEPNTACIVKILYQLSLKDPINEKDVTSMTKLLMAMYNRLPLLLQESLVASSYAISEHQNQNRESVDCADARHDSSSPEGYLLSRENGSKDLRPKINDVLAALKSKEEVLKELTPLLNKLTVNSVREIAATVLRLCLYQSGALLGRMLQTAVRNSGQILPVIELLCQIPRICTRPFPGTSQSRISCCLLDVLSGTSLDEKETENVISLITHLTMDYVHVVDVNGNLTKLRAGIFGVEEILAHFIVPGLDEGLNSEKGQSQDGDVVLPATISLSCLTSVVKSVKMERFDSLKFLVLIKTVVEIVGQNFTVSYTDIEKHWHLVIKERAFVCLEALITKAIEGKGYFSENALKCFQDQVCQSGLLSIALCHPLLRETRNFQMFPFLKTIMEEDIEQDPRIVFQTVIRLLQLGLVNEITCTDVCDVLLTRKETVDRKQLIAAIAHVLCQSLPCQMVWLPKLVLALIGKMDHDHASSSTGPRQERVAKATRPYLRYAEMLGDGLLLLNSRNVPDGFLHHFVSNFQAGIQGLLSSINHEDMPDLHYFLCYQCCLLLCCLSGEAAQGLHVLAIAMLNRWSHWLSLRYGCGAATEEITKRSAVELLKESSGHGGSGDEKVPDEKISSTSKKEDSAGGVKDEAEVEGGWNLEDLSRLRDVVVCVGDEDVMRQLLKQLDSITGVF